MEYLIWQPYTGANQIPDSCVAVLSSPCLLTRPEASNIDSLRTKIAAENLSADRPTILVWHFQEVEAFMQSACMSLNDDAPLIDGKPGTNCSANLPFDLPPPATMGPSSSPPPPAVQPRPIVLEGLPDNKSPYQPQPTPPDGAATTPYLATKVTPNVGLTGTLGDAEKTVSEPRLERIQTTALCVPKTGKFDSKTRVGVKIFEDALHRPPPADRLSKQDLQVLAAPGVDCPKDARNYFELSHFFDDGKDYAPGKVHELKTLLNRADPNDPIADADKDADEALNDATRQKVLTVRKLIGGDDVVSADSDEITLSFFNRLRKFHPQTAN
jgi:hypothetical protein